MTNTPPSVADWLADFKTRHGIDLSFADEELAADRAELAAQYAADNVPAKFADALPTVPMVDQWVAAVARRAVEESSRRGQMVPTIHTGPSLLMLGSTGVGKTSESYGAVRVLSLLGIHARWQVVSAADLYARLRPRHGVDSEAEFEAVADAPVLVVDDLGAAKSSEWVEEVNFRLVNRRYELARPTIFTSNLPPRDVPEDRRATPLVPARPGLKTVLGERVSSRLAEMTRQIALKGADRRRAA